MSKPKLEVARAAKLNAKLMLQQVSLYEVRARRLPPRGVPARPSFTFAMAFEPTFYVDYRGELLPVYALNVTIQHLGEHGRIPLAEIHVAMRSTYARSEDWAPEDSPFIDDYIGIVGCLQAWPYLRAEIQGLSTKLGFPALVLPALLAGQTADIEVRRLEAPESDQGSDTAPKRARVQKPKKTAKAR